MIVTPISSFHNNEPRVEVWAFENFPKIIDTLIEAVWAGELDSTLEQVKTARPASKK